MNEKKLPIYGVKALTLTISDASVSEASGERKVKGYLSAFDVLDSDRDIIRRGAFAKSLQEHGVSSTSNRKIQYLRNHDWEQQIGKFLELYEDEKGLSFVAQLGRSTKGNDAFLDYQDGIIREHSIGFQYVPDKITMVNDKDGMAAGGEYWEIKEVKLWEGSAVTFGANEFTPVVDVSKGADLDFSSEIQKLQAESEAIASALKNGKGTDDRLHNLEMRLRVLSQKYQSLLLLKPSIKTLQTEQPIAVEMPKPEQASGKEFLKLLIQQK